MIKIKDLSPEFQEIYIKYKQTRLALPQENKTTFEKASQFILEKNKKLIGMLTPEETILLNQPKIESKESKGGESKLMSSISNQLEKTFRKNQGAKMKRVIQEMISSESLQIPEEYSAIDIGYRPQITELHPLGTSPKQTNSKIIRLVKGASSKNNVFVPSNHSSRMILHLQANSNSLASNRHLDTKFNQKFSGISLDQVAKQALQEVTMIKEEFKRQKNEIKKNKHLFKFKIQRNEPVNLEANRSLVNKDFSAVSRDLVYYSKFENDYKKGRLMTLQNSSSKMNETLRVSSKRNKIVHNFEEDISPASTFLHAEKSVLSFKPRSTISLKFTKSKYKAKEAIDNFYSTTTKVKNEFIASLEKRDEKKKELKYKFNFFNNNY